MNIKGRVWLLAAAALPVMVAGYLYFFSRMSTAYGPAVREVLESKEVAAYLGEKPQTTLLLGVGQNLGSTSCAKMSFHVAGRARSGFVSVLLVQSPQSDWMRKEISVGWGSPGLRACSEFR